MRYIEPRRVKILMVMFYAIGVVGMIVGLSFAPPTMVVMITFMSVINVGLGAFFTFLLITQVRSVPDKRKKKKKHD